MHAVVGDVPPLRSEREWPREVAISILEWKQAILLTARGRTEGSGPYQSSPPHSAIHRRFAYGFSQREWNHPSGRRRSQHPAALGVAGYDGTERHQRRFGPRP